MRESLLGPESRARAARVELWLVRVPAVPATLGPGPDQYNTPGSTASHTTVVTHKRGCVIHTRLTHGVAFYQNVGTRSNYIFKLSGKTIKKSNNSKKLSFNWRTGYKSSDFQISSSIFGILFYVHFDAGMIIMTDPFFMVVQTPAGFFRQ